MAFTWFGSIFATFGTYYYFNLVYSKYWVAPLSYRSVPCCWCLLTCMVFFQCYLFFYLWCTYLVAFCNTTISGYAEISQVNSVIDPFGCGQLSPFARNLGVNSFCWTARCLTILNKGRPRMVLFLASTFSAILGATPLAPNGNGTCWKLNLS